MNFKSCFLANSTSSLRLAIVPSSLSISQITPEGISPANFARSTLASVCPTRFKTPPGFASSGKICPGLLKSVGLEFGSTSTFIVAALSCAEMPVVTP